MQPMQLHESVFLVVTLCQWVAFVSVAVLAVMVAADFRSDREE